MCSGNMLIFVTLTCTRLIYLMYLVGSRKSVRTAWLHVIKDLCVPCSVSELIGSGFNKVSGSVSGFGIRIRIQEGKKEPQKWKIKKFYDLKCSMFSFEG
jgi:hypothetical protein